MNRTEFVESVVADQLKPKDAFPEFSVGDTIDVHYLIVEGEKERVQVFQGVLIGDKGRGVNRTITVRRIVANEGVERIFPLHSPRIAMIEVVRRGDTRRAKLYYLRVRRGNAARIRAKFVNLRRDNEKKKLQAELELKMRAIYYDRIEPEHVDLDTVGVGDEAVAGPAVVQRINLYGGPVPREDTPRVSTQ